MSVASHHHRLLHRGQLPGGTQRFEELEFLSLNFLKLALHVHSDFLNFFCTFFADGDELTLLFKLLIFALERVHFPRQAVDVLFLKGKLSLRDASEVANSQLVRGGSV